MSFCNGGNANQLAMVAATMIRARRVATNSSKALPSARCSGVRHFSTPTSATFAYNCASSLGLRNYATHIELPSDAAINKAPPPPGGKSTATNRRNQRIAGRTATGHQVATSSKDSQLMSQDMDSIWNDLEKLASSSPSYAKDTHEKVDQDDEGNFDINYGSSSQSVPPLAKLDSLPASLREESDAVLQKPRLSAQARASKPKRQPRLENIVMPSRAKSYQEAKPLFMQSFAEFRAHHRAQAYLPDFEPVKNHQRAANEEARQPHHEALASRYDWRLRAPSRNREQKALYGRKVIWRKKNPVASAGESLKSYDTYQRTFMRFVQLEREEAEEAALLRLRKGLEGEALGPVVQTLGDDAPVQEYLSGLSATVYHLKQPEMARLPVSTQSRGAATPEGVPNDVGDISDDITAGDVHEDFTQFEMENSATTVQASFSRHKREDLPPNTFRRGKMVFIWKCEKDPHTGNYYVPELRDGDLPLEELKQIPFKGCVRRTYLNRLDVLISDNFKPSPEDIYRVDVGYDATSFNRMEDALTQLSYDAQVQRLTNLAVNKGPHLKQRDIETSGTELQRVVLDGFQATKAELRKSAATSSVTQSFGTELESGVLMQDQRIASWARRYCRRDPIRIDGDPELGLNETQLLAIASAVRYRLMLIQGPPGTGKTATIVAALKLLKQHFAIPQPILVTAHTNVAVDLIVQKCAQAGLTPLRFGQPARIKHELLEHSLEDKFGKHRFQYRLRARMEQEERLQAKLDAIKDTLKKPAYGTNIFDEGLGGKPEAAKEKERLVKEADTLEKELQKVKMAIVAIHKEIHSDLIESSDVCLATCIGSTAWAMSTADFPIVFVDEAGQCDEPTSLVPLMKGSQHAVLIGDHKQLPSVVSSDVARMEGLNMSLFERLMLQRNVPSVQLDTQYRMLPTISAFSNQQFYYHSIRDAPARQADQHKIDAPVLFINHNGRETRVGQSTANAEEADIVIQLVLEQHLTKKQPLEDIGVITAYAAQANLLSRKAREVFEEEASKLEIHTVDGFQGRDKPTIIISTVRSNSGGRIGFLSDERRLNVALTRAENKLLVVGNANTLSAMNIWARESHVFIHYMNWLQKNDLIRNWSKGGIV